jgi:UDP-N-acetylmuramoyl-tripeptide--D-alanyl-D-alanine ligase
MRRLAGVNGSIIIDDTYNASPEAVKLALSSLYQMDSPQKIAVLGNMNELGASSEEEHRKIGEYCDPKQLSLVLTLGTDANKYLAEAAETKGCKVVTFDNPYTIGDYLKSIVKPGAIVLAKGSQNGVFAEEAVKLLLANPKDQSKLVRQSPQWLKIKTKAFK